MGRNARTWFVAVGVSCSHGQVRIFGSADAGEVVAALTSEMRIVYLFQKEKTNQIT
jgi:hypothetical protein